jgi:hypothetical protein
MEGIAHLSVHATRAHTAAHGSTEIVDFRFFDCGQGDHGRDEIEGVNGGIRKGHRAVFDVQLEAMPVQQVAHDVGGPLRRVAFQTAPANEGAG